MRRRDVLGDLARLSAATLAAGALAGCAPPLRFDAELSAPGNDEPYRLDSGDRLRIIVFGQDTLSNVYAIDAQGRVSMPLVGAIPCRGRTTAMVERAVEAALRGNFVREPRVTVEVESHRPFYILGEVAAPGAYAFAPGVTVQNAVAMAGGFTPRAVRDHVELTRATADRIHHGRVPVFASIKPGDTVTVRERWF